ncbi:hypothetical protein [Fluviispira sanaruensis]|uniref:Uncharacterized protein n=1 Tax=Fluviispira sanaruensis TaxID=2493639 RepID=A0A4P2VIW6_FLUSA|nr:hypothetical protein [Fluviispira sanaruensis]BBH51814.1 hypothetical protein JCM31447_02360 [Fluviispira sanaruensis]
MIKVISFLTYVIFIFYSNILYAQDHGYIWFPVAWTFSLGEGSSTNLNLTIRSIRLNFREISQNKYIYSSLDLPLKNQKQFILTNKNLIKTVYSAKLIKLPEGKYEFIGVSAEMKNGTNGFTQIDIPYSDPFTSKVDQKIQFIVGKNNISPFPSLSAETKIYFINKTLEKKTLFDIIDDDVIYIDPIREYIKKLGRTFHKNFSGFQVANLSFPPLQSSGNYLKSSKTYYLGLILDIPCEVKGTLRFIWVNKTEPIQYSFLMKLNHTSLKCKDEKFVPQKFYFPEGNWTLQSMNVISENKKLNNFNTYDLLKKIRITKNYFSLNDSYYTLANIKERAITKVIEINLNNKRDPDAVYFLGSSEIKKNTDRTSKENYLIYFKRNYEIIDVRKLFLAKRVYNAYTSEIMKKDRIIGTINLKIELIGNDRIKRIQDKYLAELKTYSSQELVSCVSEQEIQDPLMVLNGVIKIKNTKKRSNSVDFEKNDITFGVYGKSQEIVRNCLEVKLRKFQFSRPVNPPFIANITFESL